MPLKVIEVGKSAGHVSAAARRRGVGRCHASGAAEQVVIEQSKNQVGKRRTIQVTISHPPKKGMILSQEKPIVEVFYNTDFMEVIKKVQEKYPGRLYSYSTIGWEGKGGP